MHNVQQVNIREFKKLTDFNSSFNGDNILLMGENGIGKSSIMQFIRIALGDQTSIPPNAEGEGQVIVNRDGSTYTLKVKFKDGKPVVTIISPDGLKDTRKGTLAALFGAMEFDINKFVELSKSKAGRKEQVEIFKGFLPEEVRSEILRLEANIKSKFDERTELNRLIGDTETLINNSPLVKTDLNSYKRVKISDVIEKMEKTTKDNEAVRNVVARKASRLEKIEEEKESIKTIQGEIKDLEEKIRLAKEKIEIKETSIKDLEATNLQSDEWLKTNKIESVEAYTQTINSANTANENRKAAVQLKWKIRSLAKMKDESGDLTVLIETQRQAVSDAIKDMSSPIDGLSFDEDSLLYNGIAVSPDSLSTSEIMELGIRLKIAENPDCILFIECGESLGEDRYNAILETARKEKRQVIMEQVVRGKKQLIVEVIGEK